jgi:phage repressor protein C with HTH and peptisase S24 domain
MIPIVSKLIKKLAKNFSKKIFLVEVEGLSCFPDLLPHKTYLAQNLFPPKNGDFVVFIKDGHYFVKRLIEKSGDKFILVDNLGQKFFVEKDKIIGSLKFVV